MTYPIPNGLTLRCSLAAAALACTVARPQGAFAQGKGLDEPFRAGYAEAMKGKVVGYIPVAMGFDLAQGWYNGLKKEL